MKAWSVKLTPGGHHSDHVHPQGILSSACHLAIGGVNTSKSDGWLRFGKPGLTLPQELEAEYYVKPEPGVLVLFPSYMWHAVDTFTEGNERLTIAMDVVRAP